VALAFGAVTGGAFGQVHVLVDMDPTYPGLQADRWVAPGHATIEADVYILSASPSARLVSIGYIGAIDRGISFGHVPTSGHAGVVTAIGGRAVRAAHPGGTGFVQPQSVSMRAFEGPEVQYLESGPGEAPFPSGAVRPAFTAVIAVEGLEPGDVLEFHLADVVAINWGGTYGAFTSSTGAYLDSGGDAVPEGTPTVAGVDADVPIPVPPAAYTVDLGYGPPLSGASAARLHVSPADPPCDPDYNQDGNSDQDDVMYLITVVAGGPNPTGRDPDFNRDGNADQADVSALMDAVVGSPCP
jgi:hypothetical protein